MKRLVKYKKSVLILLVVFGLFWGIRVMAEDCATDCGKCTVQASCEASPARCEWCLMPGGRPEVQARCYKRLETNWPPSPAGTILSRCSTLPDLVRYFYEWGLTIGGIATFLALLLAGVLYLTSVGRPEAMKEAKDRATSAFLGLILLLGSWLILNAINPELTSFKSGPLTLAGIKFFECDTDQDCLNLYGKDYKCNDCTKLPDGSPNPKCGDGKIEGMCYFAKEEEEKKEVYARVYENEKFSTPGGRISGPIYAKDGVVKPEFYPKSVKTFFFDKEIAPEGGCSKMDCGLCDKKEDCENLAEFCDWNEVENKCYTVCGERACGYQLHLFATKGPEWYEFWAGEKCGEYITTVKAWDRDLTRISGDRIIGCVRLLPPED